ncbi:MAG: ribonuclease M5 [Peptococcaceae bacterium]|nr:ribonuclease M5 [Peptococcaceae bacterium]
MDEQELPLIREVVVVEGKDDVAAVKRACRAEVLTTSGLGLSRRRLEEIRRAQEHCGVIVFTDPDGPGAKIRQQIDRAVPGCRHAFLYKDRKAKSGPVGVEYASPEEIRRALVKAAPGAWTEKASRCSQGREKGGDAFCMADLLALGLAGGPDAQKRRDEVARILGLGQTNSKQFLGRLNRYGISPQEFADAVKKAGL